MANVQISGSELTCVWTDVDTGRILGFAPQNYVFPGMQRAMCIPLLHASDVDRWANDFRAQQYADFQLQAAQKEIREAPSRKALRDKLKALRNHASPGIRRDIDRGLKFLEALEAKVKRKTEGALLVERVEDVNKVKKEDLATASPVYKPDPLVI